MSQKIVNRLRLVLSGHESVVARSGFKRCASIDLVSVY
jgi:hypothetical protein